jgi:hypothetical protein
MRQTRFTTSATEAAEICYQVTTVFESASERLIRNLEGLIRNLVGFYFNR